MRSKKQIKKARAILEPMIKEIKGLTFALTSFVNANSLSTLLAKDFKNLDTNTLSAYTRAIVIEYGRIWKDSSNKAVKNLDKTFIENNISDNETHQSLLELRDKLVAHADQGYETIKLGAYGITVKNERNDPNTIGDVFIAIHLGTEVKGILGWINNQSIAEKLDKHIKECQQIIRNQLKQISQKFIRECQNHANVLSELDDILEIKEYKKYSDGKFSKPDITYAALEISEPKNLQIDRDNLVPIVGKYESPFYLPQEEIIGTGYTFEVKEITLDDGSTNFNFNVTFPPSIKK